MTNPETTKANASSPTRKMSDLDYYGWSKAEYWKPVDAALLAVGIEPRFDGKNEEIPIPDKLRPRYDKILELTQRAFKSGEVHPKSFIFWAEDHDFDLPEPLKRHVLELYAKKANSADDAKENGKDETEKLKTKIAKLKKTDKPLGTREKNDLLGLILVLAIEGFGYDPDAKKSPIPLEVSHLLEALDMPLRDDAIREKLKEGKEFLPQDWKERLAQTQT